MGSGENKVKQKKKTYLLESEKSKGKRLKPVSALQEEVHAHTKIKKEMENGNGKRSSDTRF